MGYDQRGYDSRGSGGYNSSQSSGYDDYSRRGSFGADSSSRDYDSQRGGRYGPGNGSYSSGYDYRSQGASYNGNYTEHGYDGRSGGRYHDSRARGYDDRSYSSGSRDTRTQRYGNGEDDRSRQNYNYDGQTSARSYGNQDYGGGSRRGSYDTSSSVSSSGRYEHENSRSYDGRGYNNAQCNRYEADESRGQGGRRYDDNPRSSQGQNERSYIGDTNSRLNRGYVGSNCRDNRYGGNGGSNGRVYGNGRGRAEQGQCIGDVRGCGYEKIGDAMMDPRKQELWSGRAPPLEIDPEDPDLQTETQICRRPGFGKDGRVMKMNVNYFSISLDQAPVEVFKYHVDVERAPYPDESPMKDQKPLPPRPVRPLPRELVRRVINAALHQYEAELGGIRVVHDGMSALYSPQKFAWNARDFPDVNPDGTSSEQQKGGGFRRRGPPTFIVKVKLAEAIALQSVEEHYRNADENVMPILQALDVVARHLGAQRLISVGRNFFAMKKTHELKGGKELCWGYHQAIRVAEKKLLLNIDQAATVFYEPCELMKLAIAALNARSPADVRGLSERDMRNLARALRKIEVTPTHRKDRKRAIFGVSPDRADRTMVDIKGETMSVADYFYKKYNTRLRYPNLPLVNVGSKKAGRENWLPIELCEVVPGQRCPNINDLDTAEIIRQTNQRPHQRRENILSQIRQAGFENNPYLAAFGLKVDQQLETTEVRVLGPPDVQYANVSERPSGGQWNLRDKKFVHGAVLRNWGVVVDANVSPRDVNNFIGIMVDIASKCGLSVECRNPLVIDRSSSKRAEVEDLMKTCFRELEDRGNGAPQLIMVIKQDKGSVLYGRIKRMSDTVLGIPSQCIVASNLRKANPQVCATCA